MNAEHTLQQPHLPATPLDALGPSVEETVFIEERTFRIKKPTDTDSDRLIDHPEVVAAFAVDEFMPYWADLWPAARMLAKAIVREPWQLPIEALEIGCGLGLPGVAALAMGLRVTFSDYDATSLLFAADNARLNGYTDFETLQMDWRFPPEQRQWPVILAADLIYEMRNVSPIVKLIKHLLTPDGLCLITDQDRVPSHVLRDTLTAEGFQYTTQLMRGGEPGGRRFKGTLYRVQNRTDD